MGKKRKIYKQRISAYKVKVVRLKDKDDNIVYCICPKCKTVRRKINGKYTIIKRGKERNKIARFLCLKCGKWFNENTGEHMKWYER